MCRQDFLHHLLYLLPCSNYRFPIKENYSCTFQTDTYCNVLASPLVLYTFLFLTPFLRIFPLSAARTYSEFHTSVMTCSIHRIVFAWLFTNKISAGLSVVLFAIVHIYLQSVPMPETPSIFCIPCPAAAAGSCNTCCRGFSSNAK